ncbi:MAG TPA: ABC transporter ATP-binding protein [Flavobacteriales bacterium]|nr:ABC transporter ATP-binding protein [Flavobacteriales bacterium]|tara:strand:- start:49435 stop:50688 length:1254 start_codon:yes stop_codon:yes gene_type:complete
MSDIAIKIEHLYKQYRLGVIGTGTLSHDLNRFFAKLMGKDDPYAKVGEVNDRTQKSTSKYVWALQDINLEVKQGEVLGIIGKNGAGKSTLLKILSKVTAPTKGSIKAKGRIASLLEVGTGFHPELTGRENIFLNGAILGMTKAEIKAKLDEIVAFAGIEKYVDTPVKRYSSGMKVRLGFAIAAHLEPEILVVDEVLAVGDAEFQKKAIGKMQDVSKNDGRTVLFVSHNMASIEALCNYSIVMNNGCLEFNGKTSEAIDYYLKTNFESTPIKHYTNKGNEHITLHSISVNKNSKAIYIGDELEFEVTFELKRTTKTRFDISLQLLNEKNVVVATVSTAFCNYEIKNISEKKQTIVFRLQNTWLNEGYYSVIFRLVENRANRAVYRGDDVLTFEIKQKVVQEYIKTNGILRPNVIVEEK